MRTRIFKIDGQERKATLIAGIPKLVRVYHIEGDVRPWLYINKSLFTVQDELNKTVMRFVTIKYIDPKEHEQIIKDFKQLCEVYL